MNAVAQKASPHVCQVAFSAMDALSLRRWYQHVFNFLSAGQMIFFPPGTSNVQGIQGAWERCGWLVDAQAYFQLEFFQFLSPRSTPRPDDEQATDIGYKMLSLYCVDFEDAIQRCAQQGGRVLAGPIGISGERSAYLQDPEGNRIEVLEKDPVADSARTLMRPELSSIVRGMTLSVPDLDAAILHFSNGFGFSLLANSNQQQLAVAALAEKPHRHQALVGANFFLSLVQFSEHRDWPADYQISAQGFMNMAMGYRNSSEFEQAFTRARKAGLIPNGEPMDIGVFKVMYVNTPQGFSVEMLAARKPFWRLSGFKPAQPYIENSLWIDAPAQTVWDAITDHDTMGQWCLFKAKVIKPGTHWKNGLHAIRKLTGLGLSITEQITFWRPGHHYAYQLQSGAPLKNHRGDLLLTEKNGGTQLRWTIRFEAKIPGTGAMTAFILKQVFSRALRNLKSLLEQQTRSLKH